MSTISWWRRFVTFLAAWLAFGLAAPAGAHEFPLDIAVTSFVKVAGTRADVLVRAPLFLFHSDHFPIKGSELDVPQSQPALVRAIESVKHSVTLMRDGAPLAPGAAQATLSLPSDRSFDAFESAAAHIAAPMEPDLEITVDQGYVDVRMSYSIDSPAGSFALRTSIAPELGEALKLTVRWIPDHGEARALIINGGAATVDMDPSWFTAARGFVGLGVTHILTGYDHLLFLLCIVVPLRSARQLLAVVTAFTIAHSFTLIGSAFGMTPEHAWFPPFVEVLIAASIVYTALDNIIGADIRRRVALTLAFGLVHGLGFSYALKEQLQFAGTHLLTSLLAFNAGIELGQLAVLSVMLPLLWVLRRWVLPGRVGAIVLSALIAHTGWHWMEERWDLLMRQRLPMPDAGELMVLAIAVALAGLAAALVAMHRRQGRRGGTLERPLEGAQP